MRQIHEFLSGIGIEVTGGYAIYMMLCTLYVTLVGVWGIISKVVGWIAWALKNHL